MFSKISRSCGLLVAAGTTGFAMANNNIADIQSDAVAGSLVVQWGPDADASTRASILASIAGRVIASANHDAQVIQTASDTALAADQLDQYPQTIVVDVQSTDIFLGDQLNLNLIDLQALSLHQPNASRVLIPVVLEGGLYTIELAPFSSRAPGFKVLIDDGSGQLIEIEPPAPKTWRGRVVEMPNSVVAASIDEGQVSASIILHDNTDVGWFIQPLTDALTGLDTDLHVVYSADDIRPHANSCGGAILGDVSQFSDAIPQSSTLRGSGFRVCEMAYDADLQFYQILGSNTNNTIADIENVQNGMIVVYERDCAVTFVTTQILIRTSSGTNPYTTSNPESLLSQFRTQWIQNHGSIPRDLAHLMTGRNMGGTLGIAYLTAVCSNSLGYGVSRSRFTTNFAQRTALTAHEVGHNFSAQHCSGSTCKIMCAGLGGCGGIGLPNFSAASAAVITNLANSRSCLSDGGPIPNDPPVVDIILPFTTTFNEGDVITFAASANDPEDGNIAADIAWLSDLDGLLGFGSLINVSTLSPGMHVITATVLDSEGADGSDTINITINASDPPCDADLNDDGNLDFFDITIYLGLFSTNDPAADLNNDNAWDFFDIALYLGIFSQGCP